MDETTNSPRMCMKCDCEMVRTAAPFLNEDYLPIIGVERFECPECGARFLSDAQAERYDKVLLEERMRRFQRRHGTKRPVMEERPWRFPESDEALDELLDWVGSGDRVARLTEDGDEEAMVLASDDAYGKLLDFMLPAPTMEMWELRGLCFQDMPTLRDVFRAADEAGLRCVLARKMRVDGELGHWLGAGHEGERDWVHGFLGKLRDAAVASCDEDPVVVMPCRVASPRDDLGADARFEAQAFKLSAQDVDVSAPVCSLDEAALDVVLGWKAWFGGLRLFELYDALAEAFLALAISDGAVAGLAVASDGSDDGAAPGDSAGGDGFVDELNARYRQDLEERAADLAGRLVPIEELVMVSFEVEEEVLAKFEVVAKSKGLSMQNALLIALDRLLRNEGLQQG